MDALHTVRMSGNTDCGCECICCLCTGRWTRDFVLAAHASRRNGKSYDEYLENTDIGRSPSSIVIGNVAIRSGKPSSRDSALEDA